MQVQLTNHTVELRDEMNYGIYEELKCEGLSSFTLRGNPTDVAKVKQGGDAKVMMNAEALVAVKYKAARLLITSIKDKEGNEVPYSDTWLSNLSVADGIKIDAAVTDIRMKAETAGN